MRIRGRGLYYHDWVAELLSGLLVPWPGEAAEFFEVGGARISLPASVRDPAGRIAAPGLHEGLQD